MLCPTSALVFASWAHVNPLSFEQGGALSRCCVLQYSAWLDQHSREETLKGIRSALDASPADALQAARENGLLDLLHQLCGPPT